MSDRVLRALVLVGVGLLMASAGLAGQEQPKTRRLKMQGARAHEARPHTMAMAPQAATYQFLAAGPGLEGKVVKNAPFSADGVTETSRTLADGTKIARKSTSKMYRDSEGRTRREHTLGTIGHWTASDTAPRTVMINDPVAG
ncbi:MAG: hypothetical protein GY953_32990, partial [bacterium]|nr:hypothetical protein [bacterium]